MSSIWRHKGSEVWIARFKDPSGKWRHRSTKTTDRNSAKRIAAELEAFHTRHKTRQHFEELLDWMVEASSGKRPTKYTVKSWLEFWLKNAEVSTAPATYAVYKATATRFLEFMGSEGLAQIPLPELEPAAVQEYLAVLSKEVSATTVRNHRRHLAGAFEEAVKQDFIRKNPVLVVKPPTVQKEEKGCFTLGQVEKLMHSASEEWRGMILLGFYGGMRLKDAARLRWSNISDNMSHIDFEPTKTKRHGTKVRLPIHPRLRDYLEGLKAPERPEAPLFPGLASKTGSGRSGLSMDFKKLVAKSGIQNRILGDGKRRSRERRVSALTFHSLRHTFVTNLHDTNVDSETRQKLAGHTDSKTHAGYTHVQMKALQSAVDQLPDIRLS